MQNDQGLEKMPSVLPACLNSVRAACARLVGESVFSTCCFQFIYLYFVLINGTENGMKMTDKNDELKLTKI